ncbi:MAG: serine hydrolase [Clostridia bacterium]|nr:serine hydrolase [Clostridia bacterium]
MVNGRLLDGYIRRVQERNLPVDSIMVFQDGERIAEHRWTPDVPHLIYSHTKSFTATAIGVAIDEGRLSLEDRVTDWFADEMPAGGYPMADDLRLRHLLTMSSGRDVPLLMGGDRERLAEHDWVRYLLSKPILTPPGTRFTYSNGDTYLAGVMLERAVGMTLADYAEDRLLKPMGIPRPVWEHCPMGHTFGASGMWLRTADMARLGLLYLQNGEWNGRRLVSEKWIREASSRHIDTPDESVWRCGYGFQLWMNPIPESYRADGLLGQFSHVLPDRRAVISMNNHAEDAFPILDAMRDEIVPKL